MKTLAVALAVCVGSGIATAQQASRDRRPSDDGALQGVAGYVGPRVDGKSIHWPDQWPADAAQVSEPRVGLSVCVDQGGVATSVDVMQGSGVPSVDAVAVDLARLARYRAAEMNGAKMPVCGYNFSIEMRPPPTPAATPSPPPATEDKPR